MTEIKVEEQRQEDSRWVFEVKIFEQNSSSEHTVTVARSDYKRLAPAGISPKELVKESFRFLLERESKESILSSFELTVISTYFPEYEEKINQRLVR